jgi:hypothetical protein
MHILLYVALGLLGLVAVLMLVLSVFRRWGRRILARMRERMDVRGETVLLSDAFSNFRGRISDGYPLRGNAVLLLSDRALRVTVIWPRREIEVPLDRMRRIEVSHAFMGRFEPRGFVILHFVVDGAGEDAIGFTVRRFTDWVGAIIKAARPHLKAIQGRETETPAPAPGPAAEAPPGAPVEGGPAPQPRDPVPPSA